MRETRHTANTARYIYSGPDGLLEYRANPTRNGVSSAVVNHRPDCDGQHCNTNCDAEFVPGQEIAIAWNLTGDEQAIWDGLAAHAIAQAVYAVPQPIHEPTAAERGFAAALRCEAQQMRTEGHFNA